MNTLIEKAKELDFNTELEYLEYIYESYLNGQKKQSKELFNGLDRSEAEQLERALLSLLSPENLIEFFKFLGYSKTQIENVYFDNWEPVPEKISELYD